MLLSLGNIAPTSFWPKNPPQLHFLGFTYVALVLNDRVSQFFFLFSLDISFVEERTPFWLDLVAFFTYFHWVFLLSGAWNLCIAFLFLFSWVKPWWRSSKAYRPLYLDFSRNHCSSALVFGCEVWFSLIVSFLSFFVLITTKGVLFVWSLLMLVWFSFIPRR